MLFIMQEEAKIIIIYKKIIRVNIIKMKIIIKNQENQVRVMLKAIKKNQR